MEKNLYQITYSNGIIQICNLISREEYNSTIKIFKECITEFTNEMSSLSKNNKKYKALSQEIKLLKDSISKYGDFFVDDSPLGKALFNGGYLILPLNQGGTHTIKFKKL